MSEKQEKTLTAMRIKLRKIRDKYADNEEIRKDIKTMLNLMSFIVIADEIKNLTEYIDELRTEGEIIIGYIDEW